MSRVFISEKEVGKEREEAEGTEVDVEGRCRPDKSFLTPNACSRENTAHRARSFHRCVSIHSCGLSGKGLPSGRVTLLLGRAWELRSRDCLLTAGAVTEGAPLRAAPAAHCISYHQHPDHREEQVLS